MKRVYQMQQLIHQLTQQYPGLKVLNTWGEISLFYNPEGLLKRGAYCFTFKAKDGEHDAASKLNRPEIGYRLNFKINRETFLVYFNEPTLPKRPAKGGVIVRPSGMAYDPTVVDELMPHPVYAWMSWVSIIDPSEHSIQALLEAGFTNQSYADAVRRYKKAIP